MKKKLVIAAALLIIAAAAFLMLQNPLGRLIKLAIEEFGPKMTQATVKVNKVEISATDGRGALTGLYLGNPKGYKADYAVKAGVIEIVLDPASLAREVVVIHKILLDAPQISYEKTGNIANFDAIQHNVEAYLGASHKAKLDDGKKMIIDSFVIRNAHVNYNGMLDFSLPDIELHDVGKNAGGVTSAQLVKAIIAELNARLIVAAAKAVAGGVGGAVSGAGAAVKSLFGK